jgi:hypothetical protein
MQRVTARQLVGMMIRNFVISDFSTSLQSLYKYINKNILLSFREITMNTEALVSIEYNLVYSYINLNKCQIEVNSYMWI